MIVLTKFLKFILQSIYVIVKFIESRAHLLRMNCIFQEYEARQKYFSCYIASTFYSVCTFKFLMIGYSIYKFQEQKIYGPYSTWKVFGIYVSSGSKGFCSAKKNTTLTYKFYMDLYFILVFCQLMYFSIITFSSFNYQ